MLNVDGNNIKDKKAINDQNNVIFKKIIKKYPCLIDGCEYATDWRNHLVRHMKSQHFRNPADLLHCKENKCKYQTFHPYCIDRHIKTKQRRDPADLIHCEEAGCTYQTFDSGNLLKHVRAIHRRDPADLLHCEETGCTYQTFYSGHLDQHMKIKHRRDPADLIHCEEAGCSFKTFYPYCLIEHKRSNAHWYSQDKAISWEKLCYEIATLILTKKNWLWKSSIIASQFQNRQYIIPEIAIYEDQKLDTIIDAKLSSNALKDKDYTVYPQMAKKVVFWILYGESHSQKFNNHTLEFVSAKDLIQQLLVLERKIEDSIHITELITRIQTLMHSKSN